MTDADEDALFDRLVGDPNPLDDADNAADAGNADNADHADNADTNENTGNADNVDNDDNAATAVPNLAEGPFRHLGQRAQNDDDDNDGDIDLGADYDTYAAAMRNYMANWDDEGEMERMDFEEEEAMDDSRYMLDSDERLVELLGSSTHSEDEDYDSEGLEQEAVHAADTDNGPLAVDATDDNDDIVDVDNRDAAEANDLQRLDANGIPLDLGDLNAADQQAVREALDEVNALDAEEADAGLGRLLGYEGPLNRVFDIFLWVTLAAIAVMGVTVILPQHVGRCMLPLLVPSTYGQATPSVLGSVQGVVNTIHQSYFGVALEASMGYFAFGCLLLLYMRFASPTFNQTARCWTHFAIVFSKVVPFLA